MHFQHHFIFFSVVKRFFTSISFETMLSNAFSISFRFIRNFQRYFYLNNITKCFSWTFFQLEKRQKILQKHFFSWRNARKFCKAIFSVGEMPENFAKCLFLFRQTLFLFISRNSLRFSVSMLFSLTFIHIHTRTNDAYYFPYDIS